MKHIFLVIIAMLLVPAILITSCCAVVGEAAITVGGVAIAAEIIVSLGISIFVGASLKDAIEQISNTENMPVRQWVQNTMQDFAEFSGLTWQNFMNVFTSGVGYTDSGILTFDRTASNWFADLVEYAINDAGLDAYLPAVSTPELETQNFMQGDYNITGVVNPVTFFEVIEQTWNMTWRNPSQRTEFINRIMAIPDYQYTVVTAEMPKPEIVGNIGLGGSATFLFTNKTVGDTITFDSNGKYVASTRPFVLSLLLSNGVNGVEITSYSWSPQYNYAGTVAANGTSSSTYFNYYNNLGGLVTGGQTDIDAWDMPVDATNGWLDIGDRIFDYAGTIAGYDALTGSIVDINDLINTWADVIMAGVNELWGLDVVGLDETIEVEMTQEMVDEMEDVIYPQWTDDIDDVIEDDKDTPITGTNDEETEDPTRPFEYTGEYTLDLTEFFPFCIPYDLYNMLKLFDGSPVAPAFEWPIVVPSLGINETIEIDLSAFDSVASILRTLEAIAFGVGLCWATKGLIQGS